MGWPVMTSFLPHAAGERDRIAALGRHLAVPGRRVAEPDPAADGRAPAGRESTWQEPPSAASRSDMFRSPEPGAVAAGSKPGPSSVTVNVTCPRSPARLIRTADPGACLTALWSASTQQK
jgi:hypothetical protein